MPRGKKEKELNQLRYYWGRCEGFPPPAWVSGPLFPGIGSLDKRGGLRETWIRRSYIIFKIRTLIVVGYFLLFEIHRLFISTWISYYLCNITFFLIIMGNKLWVHSKLNLLPDSISPRSQVPWKIFCSTRINLQTWRVHFVCKNSCQNEC